MTRSYFVSLALVALAAACSSKSAAKPDAPRPIDARGPDAAPDAFACAAPQMMCTQGMCTDTTTDESNCGTCGNKCQGGAFCGPVSGVGACQCPGNFVPGDLTTAAQVTVNQLHYLALIGGFTDGTNADAFVPVVNVTTNMTGMDYTLSPPGGFPPSVPLIALAYGIDVATMKADAEYVAVSGTVHFDTLTCTASGSELKGTLTNVKFQGALGDLQTLQIMVDPAGCTFTVSTMTFDITSTSACS